MRILRDGRLGLPDVSACCGVLGCVGFPFDSVDILAFLATSS